MREREIMRKYDEARKRGGRKIEAMNGRERDERERRDRGGREERITKRGEKDEVKGAN